MWCAYYPRYVREQSSLSSDTTKEHQMKRLLIIGACLFLLPLAGCTVSPTPAAQGPPGPQGAPGDTGQTGAQGDQGKAGDDGHRGHPGDEGRKGDAGDQGRTGQPGDEGRKGQTGEQ